MVYLLLLADRDDPLITSGSFISSKRFALIAVTDSSFISGTQWHITMAHTVLEALYSGPHMGAIYWNILYIKLIISCLPNMNNNKFY